MIARYFVALVLLVLSASSHAQQPWTWDAVIPSGANTIEYVTGGMRVSNGPGTGSMFLGRTFGAPAGGSTAANAAKVTENLRLGVGGSTLDVAASRALAWGRVANAAVAVGYAGWVGFQAGAPIAKAFGWDTLTIGPTRCMATFTGWQCDEGQASSPVTLGLYSIAGCSAATMARCASNPSAQDACDARVQSSWNDPSLHGTVDVVSNPPRCFGVFSFPSGQTMSVVTSTAQKCPATIDALNPAFSLAAGSNPNPDGKCPTGRYNTANDPFVADRLTQWGDPTAAPTLAPRVLDLGQPITGALPGDITGPASKPGTPEVTTTTNPDGSPGPVTTKTPTTNYTYGPQTINYTTTVVTTVNNAGNVTTTTTNNGANPDPQDPCVKNPDTLGCSKFGQLPTDSPQWKTVTVPFAVENLGFGGACPAPVTWHVFSLTLTWGYDRICEQAPVIRLALLAMAAVGAISIIVKETNK